MKPKRSTKQSQPGSSAKIFPGADFKLQHLDGQLHAFRFIGWRDDYSALFVLDEKANQLVIQPELFKPESTIRFPEAPTCIAKIRLLPPPCRPTRAEADLLSEMRRLAQGREGGYQDAIDIYRTEASKRKIQQPTPPDPWELIYGEALAPKDVSDGKRNQHTIEQELFDAWAKSHGWTRESIMNCRAEFVRRHGVDDRATLARISYKMEFKNFADVWLVDCHGPEAPHSTLDLDQIRRLLDARPELVRLTPDDAEKELRLKPDPKHRTLRSYCEGAKLDWRDLRRANLATLVFAKKLRKDSQRRGVTRANKRPERAGSRIRP